MTSADVAKAIRKRIREHQAKLNPPDAEDYVTQYELRAAIRELRWALKLMKGGK